jgi:Flp pilus assembly pilin Flp
MKNLIQRFIREEDGQDMVEYAFLIVFIAFAAVLAMGVLAGGIGNLFNNIGATVDVPVSTS